MRSLFTEDIPGAKSRHLYYEKDLYLQKHLKQIERFGPKNPQQQRVFEWYTPLKKIVEPIDKDSSIIKPHSLLEKRRSVEHFGSQSQLYQKDKYDVTGKVTEGISLKNNSILSEVGKKSLEDSFARDYTENPYFPHRYANKHEENNTKLTGRRNWNGEVVGNIDVPSVQGQYFPKWN